ncbi:MAG TPA: PH domain-containing protein [Mycobacterium sp.]
MGYPDNVLADDEQVVLHRHPHVKRLIGAALVLLLATAAASLVAGFINARPWDPTAKNVIFAVVWAIWLVVVGWLTAWPFLGWLTTHFVITDRRVMFRDGLLTRRGFDIPLGGIRHVEFTRRLTERILGTGTLIVESASREPLEFYDIPHVEQVHALLYHEVFDTGEPEESSG